MSDDLLKSVLANIEGRSADESPDYFNTRMVALLAQEAGGDVLEIGSFFGVSAILTALFIRGTVYCIDPLDGRLQRPGPQDTGNVLDSPSGASVSPEVFRRNCERNGVQNVVLIPKTSYPVPDEVEGRVFGLIYIDGDHWHGQPKKDWRTYCYRSTRFVVFDDADAKHPHVMDAVQEAMSTPGWKLTMQDGSLCVMERADEAI